MTYRLSDLLIEAGIAGTEDGAIATIPDVTVNGVRPTGMTDPLVVPDADGKITLGYEGEDYVLENL